MKKDTTDGAEDTTTIVSYINKAVGAYQWQPGVTNGTGGTVCPATPTGYGWVSDQAYGLGVTMASDSWIVEIYESDTKAGATGTAVFCVYTVNSGITSGTLRGSYTDSLNLWDATAGARNFTTGSITGWTFDDNEPYLYVDFWMDRTVAPPNSAGTMTFYTGPTNNPYVQSPTVTIPEMVIFALFFIPFLPILVKKITKREISFGTLNIFTGRVRKRKLRLVKGQAELRDPP